MSLDAVLRQCHKDDMKVRPSAFTGSKVSKLLLLLFIVIIIIA